MLKLWTKHWWWVILPLMIAALGFAYVSPELDSDFFCKGESSCFREWVAASSGWAAAIAAAVTIIAIRVQIAEQRRQTDFLLGDALPTMDALEHMKARNLLVVRIVNWNRRAIVVRGFSTEPNNFIIVSHRVEVDGKSMEDLRELALGLMVPRFAIPGWENRSSAPSHAVVQLEAWSEDDLTTQETWEGIKSIFADALVLDDKHKVIKLHAETSLVQGHASDR